MAPERTTEEFLREAQQHYGLVNSHRHLLKEFLTAADMVKFALYRPAVEEGNTASQAARNFVEETTAAPTSVPHSDTPEPQEASA